jgi:glycerol uptake facilitator-like aquaporin
MATWIDTGLEMLNEGIATMFYVFFALGVDSITATISFQELEPSRLLLLSLSHGFAYAACVLYSLKMSNKAHGFLNPAVTLGLLFTNPFTRVFSSSTWGALITATFLVLSQLLGAILGCLLVLATVPLTEPTFGGSAIDNLNPTLGFGSSYTSAFWFELSAAFLLSIVIYTQLFRKTQSFTPFAAICTLGATMGAIQLFTFPFTGGSVNPARSLAASIVSGTWKYSGLYFWAPIIGSFLAAVGYLVTFRNADLVPKISLPALPALPDFTKKAEKDDVAAVPADATAASPPEEAAPTDKLTA